MKIIAGPFDFRIVSKDSWIYACSHSRYMVLEVSSGTVIQLLPCLTSEKYESTHAQFQVVSLSFIVLRSKFPGYIGELISQQLPWYLLATFGDSSQLLAISGSLCRLLSVPTNFLATFGSSWRLLANPRNSYT